MKRTKTRRERQVAMPVVLLAFLGLAVLPVSAGGLAGDLDASFGTNGVSVTTAEWGPGVPMVSQSSGKLVYGAVDRTLAADGVTETSRFWRIRRATGAGTLDTTFGTNGEVMLFAEHGTDWLNDIVVDASNRILGTGRASFEVTTTSGNGKKKKTTTSIVRRFVVVRLLADGALDTTFGDGGVAAIEIPGATYGEGVGIALHVLADGRILVAGSAREVASSSGGGGGGRGKKGGGSTSKSDAIVLVRMTAFGDLDTTFGNEGFTVHDATPAHDQPWPGMLEVQGSGRILLGGVSRGLGYPAEGYIYPYAADGALDTAFGSIALGGFSLRGMALDANDRLLASGDVFDSAGGTEFALRRYAADGQLDTAFGSGGTASIGGPDRSMGASVIEQADGKIVVAVNLFDSSDILYCRPARFTSAGAPDASFGVGGVGEALQQAGINIGLDRGLVIDPQGNITMSGLRFAGSMIEWLLVRWCGG